MKRALTQLGFGPVYHMSELLGIDAARQPSPMEMLGLGSGHCDAWTEVERRISGTAIGGSGSASVSAGSPAPAGKVLGKDAFDFLKGQENDRDDISYVSALDLPVAAYFPELLATTSFGNPKTKAKVILTTREPHEWWRSSRDSWCRLIGAGPGATALDRAAAFLYSLRPYGRRFFRMHAAMGRATERVLLGGGGAGADGDTTWDITSDGSFSWPRVCEDEAFAVKFLLAWNARVRALVPPKQLLEFRLGVDGWRELADFLGVDPPPAPARVKEDGDADAAAHDDDGSGEVPFPRSNSRAEFGFVLGIMKFLAVLTVLGVAGAVFLVRRLYRKFTTGTFAGDSDSARYVPGESNKAKVA